MESERNTVKRRLFGLVCFSKMFIDSRRGTNKKRVKIQERVEDNKGQGSGESRRQHQEFKGGGLF